MLIARKISTPMRPPALFFAVAVARECGSLFFSCRPLSEAEVREGRKRVLTVNSENASVSLQKPNGPTKHFSFDAVYDES